MGTAAHAKSACICAGMITASVYSGLECTQLKCYTD